MAKDSIAFKKACEAREEASSKLGTHAARKWRHKKTSGVYHALLIVLKEDDLSLWVVYRRVDGRVPFMRPLAEFMDGRFELEPLEPGQTELKG